MKTFLCILIALGCGVLPLAFGADTTPAPSDKSIVMIGDSITHQGNWEQLLGRNDVVNWGIPGYTTGQLAWTFEDVLREHPHVKIVFLQGGINDLTLGVPPDRVFTNYVKTIAWWRAHGVIPVVQSVILKTDEPGTNATIIALDSHLHAYCESYHVEFLELNTVLSSGGHLKPELSTDGTHLQAAAYPLWSGLVKACLARLGQ
jgi:alpha-glucosidase